VFLAERCPGSQADASTRRLRRRADSGILPPCSPGPRVVASCSSGSSRAARSPRTRRTNRRVSWPATSTNAVRIRCLRPSTICRRTDACSVSRGLPRCRRAARSPTATRQPATPRARFRPELQSAMVTAVYWRTNASRMPTACSRRTRPTAVAVPRSLLSTDPCLSTAGAQVSAECVVCPAVSETACPACSAAAAAGRCVDGGNGYKKCVGQ
jgi:hypothetical protein